WHYICDAAGRPRTDPTVGDLFGTAAAFPVTALFKAVTGEAPFPDGTFPKLGGTTSGPSAEYDWWPPGDPHYSEYTVGPPAQLIMQMITGISTGRFAMVDAYCDAPHVELTPEQEQKENIKIAAITVFDLLAFGLGDLPMFWGVDAPSDQLET